MEERKLSEYETPTVKTYTDEELIEEMGPVLTGSVHGDNAF